jgi:transposase
VLEIAISTGAIQKVIDRASQAIAPLYEKIGSCARSQAVNGIDETSWRQGGQLKWLWTMSSEKVCFFKVHNNRSKKAFEELIGHWRGILISDDYHLYTRWVGGRQSCLAHLIRQARALSQQRKESLQRFGKSLLEELQRLCHWSKAPPGEKQWTDFYSRLLMLLMLHEGADDEAGRLARRVAGELDSLWLFLEENAVEPTNNRAERALRFGVLWRKRSNGTQSEKGNRWVERILSLRQTCRQRALATYPILVNAISCFFKERQPDLSWI